MIANLEYIPALLTYTNSTFYAVVFFIISEMLLVYKQCDSDTAL